MRVTLPSALQLPGGADVLRVLLVAALLTPLPAALPGWSMPIPFGLTLGRFAMLMSVLALAWVAWRSRARAARRAALAVVVTGLLAVLLAFIVERRANTFYSESALLEGMLVLLLLHLLATVLQRLADWRRNGGRARAEPPIAAPTEESAPRHPGGSLAAVYDSLRRPGLQARYRAIHRVLRRPWRGDRPPRVRPITAAGFADHVTSAIAVLVIAFWAATAAGFLEAALALMMLAGVCALFAIVLRLPDALRVAPRAAAPTREPPVPPRPEGDHARAS